jgi:hypothetical protein
VDGDSGSGGAHLGGGSAGRLSSPMTAAQPSAAMIAARNLQALERVAAELAQRLEAERANALEAPARERFDRLRAACSGGGVSGGSSFYSGPPPHAHKFSYTSGTSSTSIYRHLGSSSGSSGSAYRPKKKK